jgi:hypothetical protein
MNSMKEFEELSQEQEISFMSEKETLGGALLSMERNDSALVKE